MRNGHSPQLCSRPGSGAAPSQPRFMANLLEVAKLSVAVIDEASTRSRHDRRTPRVVVVHQPPWPKYGTAAPYMPEPGQHSREMPMPSSIPRPQYDRIRQNRFRDNRRWLGSSQFAATWPPPVHVRAVA
jgi:hypothetical protein